MFLNLLLLSRVSEIDQIDQSESDPSAWVQPERRPNQGIFNAWENTQKLLSALPAVIVIVVGMKITFAKQYATLGADGAIAQSLPGSFCLWLTYLFIANSQRVWSQHLSLRVMLSCYGELQSESLIND